MINQVAAVALQATIDCDKFANAHSSDSHYDKKSFVGLAWRPSGETICAECYSTGKTNLPGSRRGRHMLRSFSRMAPEMYQYSNKPELSLKFGEHIRYTHNPENTLKRHRQQSSSQSAPSSNKKRGTGCGGSGVPYASSSSLLWSGGLDDHEELESCGTHKRRDLDQYDADDMDNSELNAIFGV